MKSFCLYIFQDKWLDLKSMILLSPYNIFRKMELDGVVGLDGNVNTSGNVLLLT